MVAIIWYSAEYYVIEFDNLLFRSFHTFGCWIGSNSWKLWFFVGVTCKFVNRSHVFDILCFPCFVSFRSAHFFVSVSASHGSHEQKLPVVDLCVGESITPAPNSQLESYSKWVASIQDATTLTKTSSQREDYTRYGSRK